MEEIWTDISGRYLEKCGEMSVTSDAESPLPATGAIPSTKRMPTPKRNFRCSCIKATRGFYEQLRRQSLGLDTAPLAFVRFV